MNAEHPIGYFRCIFCKECLTENEKPEHVLLNALGGRLTVKTVICSDCNHKFGIGPDQDLADSTAFIRNICNLKAGDNDSPPRLNMKSADGKPYRLEVGMQPRMTSGNMNVEITEDTIRVDIIAFTHAQAEVMAEGAARKIAKDMGRTKPSEIAAIKDTILSQKKSGFKPAPEVKETLEFGRGQAVRAKAKACLVLWARFTANEEVLDERYEKARRYARYGEMPQNEDFLTLDTRLLPIDTIKYGSSPNIIWAGSDHHGKVYGYFCLYGAIGWRFVLCDGGAPPSQSICLISNPLENTTWELLKNTDSILPIDWVSEEIPAYPEDMKDIADRLRPLLRHSQEVSRDIMLFRLVEDGLRKAGCRDGDIIKPEHLSVLSRHIANALTAMVTRTEVPDEEPTT